MSLSHPPHSDEQSFVEKYFLRNFMLYLGIASVCAYACAFSDMLILVPNLAMKLHAPSWLAVLPGVAITSIAYIPVVFMGWLMRPGIPRKPIYTITCFPVYGSLLLLGVALMFPMQRSAMLIILLVSIVLYGFAMGLTLIPNWDLFSKMFPADKRAKVTGNVGATMQFFGVFGAMGAAWLISSKSPLPYPKNYGLGLIISAAGGAFAILCLIMQKEYRYSYVEPRVSFGEYWKRLCGILREDKPFRQSLLGGALAATIVSISSLMLLYAKNSRGFQENHVSLLIAVRPWFGVPASIIFGYLASRIGVGRVCAIIALIAFFGVFISPFVFGVWQIAPMILVSLGGLIAGYVLVAIMEHAAPGKVQDYLTIYYMVILIPGFTPILLARVMAISPMLVLGILMLLALSCAAVFLCSGSRNANRFDEISEASSEEMKAISRNSVS